MERVFRGKITAIVDGRGFISAEGKGFRFNPEERGDLGVGEEVVFVPKRCEWTDELDKVDFFVNEREV